MSDKAEQKLRACPFCGSTPDVWEEFGNDHRAGCTNGDCPGSFGDFGIGLKAWNTRPTEDKLVEALEEVIKYCGICGGKGYYESHSHSFDEGISTEQNPCFGCKKARQALAEVK